METMAQKMAAEAASENKSENPSTIPSESQNDQAASSQTFSSDHFATGDDGPEFVEAEIVTGLPRSKFLTHEEFFGTFEFSFAVAGAITKLQSLPISQDEAERQSARNASDAIYDICERHPQLHFMIDADSVYLKAVAAVGVFGMAKYEAVKAEVAARHEAPLEPEGYSDN